MQRTPEGIGQNMPGPSRTELSVKPLATFVRDNILPPIRSNVSELHPSETNQAALHSESFFVDGYDVKDPSDAKKYLIEVHGFDLPRAKGDFDKRTLYHLARAIQKEKRAGIYEKENPEDENEPYFHQNVAEHSFNVSVSTLTVAASERPELSLKKIGIMATFHDLVPEANGRDTPVNDEEAQRTKEARETASATIFYDEIGHDSEIAQVMKEYEDGRTAEARFVKGMDKVEAAQLSLDTKAILHKERYETFTDVARGYLVRASIDDTALDLMAGIVTEIGRKWNGWGCIPFEADPEELVKDCLKEIEAKSAEVLAFEQAIPDGMPIPELEQPSGDLINFPVKPSMEVTPPLVRVIINAQILRARNIGVIGLAKPETTPPTDPGSVAAMAA